MRNGINYRENIYEYKKEKYVITTRGRIFWIQNTIVKTLRDMNLIDRYEILKELTQSSITTQTLNEKTAQQKTPIGRVRRGSILEINTENIQTKYHCTKNNDVILFLNRTLHFETLSYIPIIKMEDLHKPVVLIGKIDKPIQKWLLNKIKNASNWSREERLKVANKTNLFLQTLTKFVAKRALTLLDIRKGYWFLLVARSYGMLEWTWITSRIYKLDQDNQVIKGITFPNPPTTSDFIWDNNLYTYSNYGNEMTPLQNITKLRSFKYEVAQRKKIQSRKERMEFTPGQSIEFTERQTARIIELIVRHTRKITDRITLGEKDREKLWTSQKELNTRIQQNNQTQLELELKLQDLSSEARKLEQRFDNMTEQITHQLTEELINLTRRYVSEEIKRKMGEIAKTVYALNRDNREEFKREILRQTQLLEELIGSLNQTLIAKLKTLRASVKNNSAEIVDLEGVVSTLNKTTATSIDKWSKRVINNTKTIKEESDKLNKRIDEVAAELNKRIEANQRAIANLRQYVDQVAILLNQTIAEMDERIANLTAKLRAFQEVTNEKIQNLTQLLKRTDLQLRREIGLTRKQLENRIQKLREYSDKVAKDIRTEVKGNRREISKLSDTLGDVQDNFETMKRDVDNLKMKTKGLDNRLNAVEKDVKTLKKVTKKLVKDVKKLEKRKDWFSDSWWTKAGKEIERWFVGAKDGVIDIIDAVGDNAEKVVKAGGEGAAGILKGLATPLIIAGASVAGILALGGGLYLITKNPTPNAYYHQQRILAISEWKYKPKYLEKYAKRFLKDRTSGQKGTFLFLILLFILILLGGAATESLMFLTFKRGEIFLISLLLWISLVGMYSTILYFYFHNRKLKEEVLPKLTEIIPEINAIEEGTRAWNCRKWIEPF